MDRIEYEDYPETARREAIVNALIHRDYQILGSEIHIDMLLYLIYLADYIIWNVEEVD